jgi:hypothetical protein
MALKVFMKLSKKLKFLMFRNMYSDVRVCVKSKTTKYLMNIMKQTINKILVFICQFLFSLTELSENENEK